MSYGVMKLSGYEVIKLWVLYDHAQLFKLSHRSIATLLH